MKTPSIAAVVLLDNCLRRHGAHEFGRRFQGAVAGALRRINGYEGCYLNPGAGQPDIIATPVGFEVKTTQNGRCELDDKNYLEVRAQFPRFLLVGLRTDQRPFSIWVLQIPRNFTGAVQLTARDLPDTPPDHDLEVALAANLSVVLESVGTRWSEACTADEARQLVAPHQNA